MIDALEQLYRARRPEFCRAAAAIAGDRALGEDAVQEAFARRCASGAPFVVAARWKRGFGGSS
jgi:DNA-directed RNA polymerase specialized sigma24 family protein